MKAQTADSDMPGSGAFNTPSPRERWTSTSTLQMAAIFSIFFLLLLFTAGKRDTEEWADAGASSVSVNISRLYKSTMNDGRLEALAEATKIPDVV